MFSTNIYSELRQLINDLKLNPENYDIKVNEDKNRTDITLDNKNNHYEIHLKEENYLPPSASNRVTSSISQTKPNQEEIYNIKTKENNNQNLKNDDRIKSNLKQAIQEIKTDPKKEFSEIDNTFNLSNIQNDIYNLKNFLKKKYNQSKINMDVNKMYDYNRPYDSKFKFLPKQKLNVDLNNLIESFQKEPTDSFNQKPTNITKNKQQKKQPINNNSIDSTLSSSKTNVSSLESVRNELYSSITNYLYFLTGNKDIVKLVFPKQIFDQKFRNLEKTIRNIMT